jgi:hypothetical protein
MMVRGIACNGKAAPTWVDHLPLCPSLPYSGPARLQTNRLIVLALTFLCYTAYHASRKPPSIVKSVLHGDASANGGGPASPRRLPALLACVAAAASAVIALATCSVCHAAIVGLHCVLRASRLCLPTWLPALPVCRVDESL